MNKSIKKTPNQKPHRKQHNGTTEQALYIINLSLSEARNFMTTYHLMVDLCEGTSLIAVIQTTFFPKQNAI